MQGRPSVYGLIESAVGSTDVQSWMSPAALQSAAAACWQPKGSPIPPSHSKAPAGGEGASMLYNAMVHPLVPFRVSAYLWDQGVPCPLHALAQPLTGLCLVLCTAPCEGCGLR